MSRFRSATASAALAAAILGVTLGARAGSALERTAIVELALIAAGAAAIGAAILIGRRGRLDGGGAVFAFAILAAITALSVGWSITPDVSYIEAGRTLAYLATFAGAVALARILPDGAAAVARGVLLAAVVICAYGLAARVWPASFDEVAFSGRIGQPFDYWNALAGTAALGLASALWLGARRTGSAFVRALAFPATGLLLATLLIAQSRGALAGAVVGCALWFAIVPLRLRSLVQLLAAAIAAAPVIAWALSKDPFTTGLQPLAAREAIAGEFGLMLAVMLVALLVTGAVVEAVRSRYQPSLRTRFRVGLAVTVVAALVPLALVTSVATSDRGLTGTISDRVDELTADDAAPPTGGGRLGSVASERFGYWREAFEAFEEEPVTGLGAGSFELARLAHRNDGGTARRAHGFVAQTASDLGLLGGAAVLLLLAAWLAAPARATGLWPRRWWRAPDTPRPPWTSERAALVALALAAVAYGVQSATDWTWFVPGLTVAALLAAGFVAGRGPLAPVNGAAARQTVVPATSGHSAAATVDPSSTRRATPARLLACATVALIAVLCGWSIWQPVVADRAMARSYDRLADGDPLGALHEASDARDLDPRSIDPHSAMALALADLDRNRAAVAVLRRAAADRPRDPDPWLQIAELQLDGRDSPRLALLAVEQAFARDPYSKRALALRDLANGVLAQRQAAAQVVQ